MSKSLFKAIFSCLILFIIGGSAYWFYLKYKINHSEIQDANYKQDEAYIRKEIENAHTDKILAIQNLEKLSTQSNLLKNRKNYILSKLYQGINEPALAFMRAYEIDPEYLSKYSGQLRINLAEKIGLESFVLSELEKLKKKYPQNPKYSYEIAKSFLRQNLNQEAQKLFLEVQTNFPETEYALGADYYLAGLSSDKKEKANKLFNYLKSSPEGNLAHLAVENISELDDKKFFAALSNYIALDYYHHKEYQKTIESINPQIDSPDLYLLAWVDSLVNLKQQDKAKKIIISYLGKINDSETFHKIMDILIKISSKEELNKILTSLAVKENFQDRLLWEIAQNTNLKEDYSKVYEKFPESLYAGESLAKVFWKEYERENYHRALDLAKKHWDKYDYAKSHSFVAFWAGKIHLKQNDTNAARDSFNNLILAHPHDYYTFRAQQILDKQEHWYSLPNSNEFTSFAKWSLPALYKDDEISKNYGQDILELTKVEDYQFILNLEPEIKISDKFKLWLYAKNLNYPKMIDTAQSLIKTSDEPCASNESMQLGYPLPYADLIADEASKNLKVDPLLVHSLILQESHYQQDIESPAGALGLMQVMPYTASSLAKQMEMSIPSPSDLFQPSINIKIGIRYMEEVFAKYQNNIINAIASYNAGPNAVNNWISKNPTTDYDEYIEKIPYEETKNYVKKVLENYWIYKKLYA